MRKLSLLLILGGLLYSCATTQPPLFNPKENSPQQIYSRLDRQFRSVTTFSGDATIAVDTPEQSGQVRSEISVRPGKQAEIILKSPFGGKVGRLVVKRNYLLFYNAQDELQFVGSPDNTGIPALPAIFTGEQELLTIMTGMINLPDDLTQTLSSDSMNGQFYELTFKSDTTTSRYWYNPEVAKITKYQESKPHSDEETVIEFDKFVHVDGFQLPRSIRITQPGERRMLAIYYHSINVSREKHANAL